GCRWCYHWRKCSRSWHLDGTHRLMARLLYGTGMRLMECLRLRVKDLDLKRGEITVRQGRGGRDRVTMVPRSIHDELRSQLGRARVYWMHDRDECRPGVESPADDKEIHRRPLRAAKYYMDCVRTR